MSAIRGAGMWKCWFVHAWTSWSRYTVTKDGGAVQDRSCLRCGKSELRFL